MSDCNGRGWSGVDPSAFALKLFRVLPSGEGRDYTGVTFPQDPYQGCERFIRKGLKLGWLAREGEPGFGMLDVMEEDGSIVQDYAVTSAQAFQEIKRELDLRVESTDGEEAAHV